MKGINVLITGGTGMIGSRLTALLLERGYQVSHLSRGEGKSDVKTYRWDIPSGFLEDAAVSNADYIVHLAGANVFDEKWTKSYKNEITASRAGGTLLLAEKIKTLKPDLKAFISASAIGIYGSDTGQTLIREDAPAGNDFISEVVKEWEAAADKIQAMGIRTVKIRTGIVFADGGALKKLVSPVKKGAGAPLATGRQLIPWIHIDDLCGMYIFAIENSSLHGAYNASAPKPASNEEVTRVAAKILHKPLILPNVPEFVLKIALGSEKAAMVTGGNNISPEKIQQAGFQYKFPELEMAMEEILSEN